MCSSFGGGSLVLEGCTCAAYLGGFPVLCLCMSAVDT